MYHMIEKSQIMTPTEGKTLRNLEHAVSKRASYAAEWLSPFPFPRRDRVLGSSLVSCSVGILRRL